MLSGDPDDVKQKIGTTIQEIRPKLYFDGLDLPTFLVASDSDEMIRFSEVQAIFKAVRSPLKKLRVVRGSHTQERPEYVLRQCLDFVQQLFLTFPSLAVSKENLVPQRWANDCSEFLSDLPPVDRFFADPFDRPANRESTRHGSQAGLVPPLRDLNQSLSFSQHHLSQGQKSPRLAMQKVVPYSLKADTPRIEREVQVNLPPLQATRFARLDPHLLPRREASRSITRRKSPSNVKITKLSSSQQPSLASSLKALPEPRQALRSNFMEVESDEEFKYF